VKPIAAPAPHFSPAFVAASIALAVLATSPDAHAELDGTMPPAVGAASAASAAGAAAAVARDAADSQTTLLNGALRMRTFTDNGGTTLNEYATSTGQIIAYTWSGPTMPDLRALLGSHNASYQAGVAAGQASGNLHDSRIVRDDLIVESGGPMRGYVGRAWLPQALPPGVSADDFQ
jgi:hypothetical protein